MIPESNFGLPGARVQYGPSRTVDVVHIDLFLRPNLVDRTLAGVCTLTVSPVDSSVVRLDLDAADMLVETVFDLAGPLEFTQHRGTLAIELRSSLSSGETHEVSVKYCVEQPVRGLFFIAPGDSGGGGTTQCWTHGHAGGARYWFPCFDNPEQRQSSSTTIEVELGLFALANGALIARQDNATAGTTTFRYEQLEPHASYLFTMVVGHFAELALRSGSVPLFAYAPPGRESDALRTFAKTETMLGVLERFTGRPYPYARYSQITVADFPFVGMENTSATTLTDEWIADERAYLTHTGEWLLVHELAHQWFGNLISSSHWADVWLNEGFASYCEAIWAEAEHGWDGYLYYIFRQTKAYLEEAAQKYTRPIVCNYFRDPIDLFDRHLYEKASAVLHMLRGVLGEASFAAAIVRYVRDNAGYGVETIDLVRAVARATGRNVRAFFAQWVERSGHPNVKVIFDFDADRRVASVRVLQRQPIDAAHPAYRFTLAVGLLDRLPAETAENSGPQPLAGERRVLCEIDGAEVTCLFELDRLPALVRIDPGAWTLCAFELEVGTELACATLEHDPDPIARIRAAQMLANEGSARARSALTTAVVSDRFWGARVEYAALLGEARAPWARTALLRATTDRNAHVRRAVCSALGNYADAEVAQALRWVAAEEPAVEVVRDALIALGKTRAAQAADVFSHALAVRSWRDVVGAGALLGLAESGLQSAAGMIYGAFSGNSTTDRRQSAIRALAVIAARAPSERSGVVARLSEALNDSLPAIRQRSIEALEAIGDAAAIPSLERMALREPLPWIRGNADRAAIRIRSATPSNQRLDAVHSDVSQLRTDHERLRERVEGIEG